MAGDSVLTICRVYSVNKLCGIAIASVDSGRTHAVVDGSKCPKAVAAVGVEEVAGSIRNRMLSIVKKRKRGSEVIVVMEKSKSCRLHYSFILHVVKKGTSVVAGGQETEDAVESTRIKSFNLLDTTIKTQNKRLRAVLAANEVSNCLYVLFYPHKGFPLKLSSGSSI
jgi:hypothetical protein